VGGLRSSNQIINNIFKGDYGYYLDQTLLEIKSEWDLVTFENAPVILAALDYLEGML
jgi:hypothetical protein